MAQKKLSNYQVSKKTALLLDALQSLSDTFDSVQDYYYEEYSTDEKASNEMQPFSDDYYKLYEGIFKTLIGRIEENVRMEANLTEI